jgi:undecaprenyl-diphosphatase
MWLISQPYFWLPLFVFFIFLLKRKFKTNKGTIIGVLAILLAVGMADFVATWGFKHQIKRYRPTHHAEIGPQVQTVTNFSGEEYRGGKYSFISGHSTTFFAIATTLFLLLDKARKLRWLFLWAALVAYSRIYLGVHYPSDIFVGAITGILIGNIVMRLHKYIVPQPNAHG